MRTKVEVDVNQGHQMVEIQLQDQHDQQEHDRTAREPAKAEAAPTWTDPDTGLTWAGKDNGSNLTWQQAVSYCNSLTVGNYRNWRLPEISELAGIYDPAFDRRRQHVIGGIRITGVGYWSNTAGDDSEQALDFVFVGGLRHSNFRDNSEGLRALCVRPSGE